MYEIEKGVPIPGTQTRTAKYRWDEMEVGDSKFIPNEGKFSGAVASHHFCKRHGVKFVTRKLTENGVKGVRVWRVE